MTYIVSIAMIALSISFNTFYFVYVLLFDVLVFKNIKTNEKASDEMGENNTRFFLYFTWTAIYEVVLLPVLIIFPYSNFVRFWNYVGVISLRWIFLI